MNVQFGEIIQVWDKADNPKKAKQKIAREVGELSKKNLIAIATEPKKQKLPEALQFNYKNGFVSQVITGEDAKNVLSWFGIQIGSGDGPETIDNKIKAGMASHDPNLTPKGKIKKLQDLASHYVGFQENNRSARHLNLNVVG